MEVTKHNSNHPQGYAKIFLKKEKFKPSRQILLLPSIEILFDHHPLHKAIDK